MEEKESLKQREQMLGYLAAKKKLFKPPGECINTDKEENRRMRERITLYTTELDGDTDETEEKVQE